MLKFKELIKDMDKNLYTNINKNNFLKKLNELKSNKKEDITDLKKINYEIEFLSFNINENELVPLLEDKINNKKWPDCSKFNEEQINYLQLRINNTSNWFIKVLYIRILWENQKYPKLLESFIDSSLKLNEYYKNNLETFSTKHNEIKNNLIHSFKKSFYINKYKTEEIKREILNWINDKSYMPYLKRDLIKFTLSQKKSFKNDDMEDFSEICKEFYNNNKNSHRSIEFLELGQKIDNKLNKTDYDWSKKLAKLYEKLINNTTNPHLQNHYCYESIKYYKKINDIEKINGLINKLEDTQNNMKFQEYSTSIKLNNFYKIINKLLKEKKNYNLKEILEYLINNNEYPLMLNKQEVETSIITTDLNIETYFTKEIVDSNYNRQEIINFNDLNEDEKAKKIREINIKMNYQIKVEVYIKNYLDELFIFLFRNIDSFNFNEIIEELKLTYFNNNLELLEYLVPSINSYFMELNTYYLNPNFKKNNFILFIDSVVSKIELIIKKICENNDIITTDVFNNETSEKISLEKIFSEKNKLETNEKFRKLISYEDYVFLKYLFVKNGLNLRNKSSHSLDLEIYNFSNANLLLLSLFRLIKYV